MWDLLGAWTGAAPGTVEPRLALQLVHEAALCTCSLRQGRSLSQKGFDVANGLPFVASDPEIHALLDAHTVREAECLQIALGKLRRASGHFDGQLLAIDPHRLQSYTQRQTRRHRQDTRTKAFKVLQTFFCLDAQTGQPLGFHLSSAARTVAQATPPLLALAPLPESAFTRRWAGYATAKQPWTLSGSFTGPGYHLIQRSGEKPGEYFYKSFFATGDRPELADLSVHYPERWHIEESFKANQALGWQRAGTLNLNIRYGQMTLALVAQALLHPLRQRLSSPFAPWDAQHFADNLFGGLDGAVQMRDDTIVVTYDNAPNVEHLRQHYEHRPAELAQDGVNPRVPWLYSYQLDFRFA